MITNKKLSIETDLESELNEGGDEKSQKQRKDIRIDFVGDKRIQREPQQSKTNG